jgi:hypothetical protein
LVGLLVDWLVVWLVDWLVGWLVDWLVGWAVLGCIEAMLRLSAEHLWPYWGGMSVKVWEMPRGLGGPGHKPWFYHAD